MDWLMTIKVIGGSVLAFGVAVAAGLWLYDVQSPAVDASENDDMRPN